MLLTRQQLEERLIALQQASLQLVGDMSLETLLERIATVACEQAQAQYAALGVQGVDGKLRQFITVGMSDAVIRRIPHPPAGRGMLGALMNTEESIRIPDIQADPRSVGFPKNHPPMNSFLGVPIRLRDEHLGQIYLTNKINSPEFTPDDEQIIRMLAAYAAVAIHNARLYDELKVRDQELTRRNQDLTLLNSIAEVLTSYLERDEILQKALSLVMDYLNVDAGEIFLLTDDGQALQFALHRGQAGDAFRKRRRFNLGEGILGQVAKNGEAIVIHDLAHDVRYPHDAIVDAGFRQMGCFPLTSSGNLVGVLNVATRSFIPLDEQDIDVVTAIGSWAGLAIENARLHKDARRLAILEERDRFGMDLHDGIIQSIYGAGLVLEHTRLHLQEDPLKAQERIQQAIDSLNRTIHDLRSYILDLRPRQLGDENLMNGLSQLVAEFRENTLAKANLTGQPADVAGLLQLHATALFHICQEALANIAKHAGAKEVDVKLWATPERIMLEIRDDGDGFELTATNSKLGHGLSNMRTRIQQVGGEMEISSVVGEGTTITVWVPKLTG